MLDCYTQAAVDRLITISPIYQQDFHDWLKQQPNQRQQWITANGFTAQPGQYCVVPDASGQLQTILVGLSDAEDFWSLGGLPKQLTAGTYQLDNKAWRASAYERACLAWGLGSYQFTRYREQPSINVKLLLPATGAKQVDLMTQAIYWVRDLINTPTADMGPNDLTAAAQSLVKTYKAKLKVIVGDKLLKANFPLIHAVGRAGSQPPQLIDLRWGDPKAKQLTLVGKGVCFDTGGLDIKPPAGMRHMKKDMGGAAMVLGLARLIMSAELPICLRVLIPAVENNVGNDSYRPGDVIRSRQGNTIEITNTDAEGRLVLADALSAATTEPPDLLLDFATLTGAARIALGPDLPVLFSNNTQLSEALLISGDKVQDQLWQLPLYAPYQRYLRSQIADYANAAEKGFAGAITAALFLQLFVPTSVPWAHFDCYCWNGDNQPGRPAGGEALALRAVYHYLLNHFIE